MWSENQTYCAGVLFEGVGGVGVGVQRGDAAEVATKPEALRQQPAHPLLGVHPRTHVGHRSSPTTSSLT